MRAVIAALESAVLDLRYGARLLWHSPVFSFVAIASLAIGLGTGVGLFTFMNALLLRPLPGRDTEEIQRIYTSNRGGGRYGSSSFADFQSFDKATPELFAAACATTNVRGNLLVGTTPEPLYGALMSGGCFETIRLRPHLGRLLTRADDVAGGNAPAIVVSHAFWQRGLGGEAGVVGRAVLLNGASAVIVGVSEPGFAGLSLDAGADFFASTPLAPALLSPRTLTNRGERRFAVYVRLKDTVMASRAGDRLAAVAAGLRADDPVAWIDDSSVTRTVTVAGELESRFVTSAGAAAGIATGTFGAIAALLAIACVNLATMIMARGAARTRELNVRLALGASRARILRQLATESLLISIIGGATGLAIVSTGLRLVETYRPPELPSFNLALDWRVMGFALLLALVAPLLFGLFPGAHALRLAIAEGLKGRPDAFRRRLLRVSPRELLLAIQVVASFALLISSTLFVHAVTPPSAAQTGAAAGLVAVVPIELGNAAASDVDRRAIADRLLQAANRVLGVDHATAAAIVPMTGSFIGFAGGAGDRPDSRQISLDGNVVAPGYFELMGIARRTGRTFAAGDQERAPRVAVVSESMARRLWQTSAAVGRTLRVDDEQTEVIGVVADAPYRSLDGPQPVLYLPVAQVSPSRFVVHARVSNGGEAVATLDRALRAVDPRVLVGTTMPIRRFLDQALAPERAGQWIGGAAGLLQLALAVMAVWGLVAYAVERRRSEIAIRRALGATEAGIVQLVMRPSLLLLAAGSVVGSLAGVAAAEVLHSEFTGLAPLDLTVVPPATLVVAAVVVAAAWWPARRAISIEPASALKQ